MPFEIQLLDPANVANILKCFPVFAFLRPHLDEAEFVQRVEIQAREGYQIGYVEVDGVVLAAAGYRVLHFLAWGRVLYIDDLITHPEQKKSGLATTLMTWLTEQGKQLDCDEIHLDTGYQRHDAHRLYLNQGFEMSCHHMAKKLK